MADKFIRYTDVVDSIPEAFSMVMGHMDEFKRPSISIQALAILDADDEDINENTEVEEQDGVRFATKYEVIVYGHVEGDETAD